MKRKQGLMNVDSDYPTWRCSCSLVLPRWGSLTKEKRIRCTNCQLVYKLNGELVETLLNVGRR